MMPTEASWTDGKKTITGRWLYIWSRDRFVIWLDGKDDLGMRRREFETCNDSPEFGKFKLVKAEKETK